MKKNTLYFFSILLFGFLGLDAVPPKTIPQELLNEFTMNGAIPVTPRYYDNSYPPEKPLVYTVDQVNSLISMAEKRMRRYYRKTDTYLYSALDDHDSFIRGKDVAIMGSVTPWYEAIVISRGGHPFSIDYNRIVSEDPRIVTMTVDEYQRNPRLFDVLISISSYEHDGLGRYGDPLNPNGDFQAMQTAKNMLSPGGILILAIPVGPDRLCWNAHRIYGKIRLPLMLQGWEIVQSYGFNENKDFVVKRNLDGKHQPVFILKPL